MSACTCIRIILFAFSLGAALLRIFLHQILVEPSIMKHWRQKVNFLSSYRNLARLSGSSGGQGSGRALSDEKPGNLAMVTPQTILTWIIPSFIAHHLL